MAVDLSFHSVTRLDAESKMTANSCWIDLKVSHKISPWRNAGLLHDEVALFFDRNERVRVGLIAKAINEANAEADRIASLDARGDTKTKDANFAHSGDF